jgi:hypothetical protein
MASHVMHDGDSKKKHRTDDKAPGNSRKRGRGSAAISIKGASTSIPVITVSRRKKSNKAVRDDVTQDSGVDNTRAMTITRNNGTTETEPPGNDTPKEPSQASDRYHIIKIDELGFEILDTIFSFFSNGNLKDQSHHENQQSLLGFCNASRGFYNVAR